MVDLSGGPDGPLEHGFSNTVFIIPGLIIFGLSGITNCIISSNKHMDSLHSPRLQEMYSESEYGNAKDLSTEKLLDIINGKESSYLDLRDVREILLHRKMDGDPLLIETSSIPLLFYGLLMLLLSIFAFFGWKLYQSLKDREKKREEKKKLKQKKKK